MPSSAKISFISTPLSHFINSTSPSILSNGTTSLREPKEVSHLIADLVGTLPLRTFQRIFKTQQPADNKVEKENFQVGFPKNLQEEMSEFINVWSTVQDVLQIDKKIRGKGNGSKLKINQNLFTTKVFELINYKTIQSIRIYECDLMARVVLKFKARMSQNQLSIIDSFLRKSCPFLNIPFQSKDYFNISQLLSFLYKTPFLEEEQLWLSYISIQLGDETKNFMVLKSQISKDRQLFDQNKFKDCSYFDDNLADDKCSTASRSSINTHERNFEINDIDSGNILEFSLNLRFNEIQSPPRSSPFTQALPDSQSCYSQFFGCSAYDGCFVGDLDIAFTPSDNLLTRFDEEPLSVPSKKKSNRQKQHQNQNPHSKNNASNETKPLKKKNIRELQTVDQGQKAASSHQKLELKLFTLPNFAFDPRCCTGLSAVTEQNNQSNDRPKNKPSKKGSKNSIINGNEINDENIKKTNNKETSNSKTKNTQNQKAKAKKAPQDKSIKLWDMISVNGKLKEN